MVGGALTGALSMYFGVHLMAPHGGLFVLPLYLGGFVLGSTVAMAALTAALSASSSAMPRPEALLRHVLAVASFGSVMLGGWWMVA